MKDSSFRCHPTQWEVFFNSLWMLGLSRSSSSSSSSFHMHCAFCGLQTYIEQTSFFKVTQMPCGGYSLVIRAGTPATNEQFNQLRSPKAKRQVRTLWVAQLEIVPEQKTVNVDSCFNLLKHPMKNCCAKWKHSSSSKPAGLSLPMTSHFVKMKVELKDDCFTFAFNPHKHQCKCALLGLPNSQK